MFTESNFKNLSSRSMLNLWHFIDGERNMLSPVMDNLRAIYKMTIFSFSFL